jgi:hypothetical protein
MTPDHPANPFVTSEYWFQQDPSNPFHARTRVTSPEEDVWRQNNRVLRVNRQTGGRSFQLNNAMFDFGGMGAWEKWLPQMAENMKLSEVTAAKMPGAEAADANAFWFGECHIPAAPSIIYRVWISRTNQLPVRLQWWSTDFPQVAPEVLLRECLLSDFNADFQEETFAIEITDQDLASLAITRAEMDALGEQAMSFHLTGAPGAEVIGTIEDEAGVHQVRGRLPFGVVHTQHGNMTFDFRMADGIQRSFGVQLKIWPEFSAMTSRITGWASTNWAGTIQDGNGGLGLRRTWNAGPKVTHSK